MIGQKFFIYARKSTDNEDMQVRSIDDQLAVLREFASREGITVIEELVEKQSAKITGRPIFNMMLERIEFGEATGILSWHPDRLARNSVDGGKILYLVDRGVITALKFPQFWFEPTAQGKFMLSLAFGQSKYYIDSLSENTKRGLHQKAKGGDFPCVAPVGYFNNSRTKTVAVNVKEAKVIKSLFETFSTGKYKIMDMPLYLKQNGIVTKSGKNLHVSKVSKILKNPFYYGLFRYCGEIYEGRHKPIISKKLFDQVQEVLAKKSNHSWQKPKVFKPFLGLFRCGECGMMVTAENHTKYYKGTNRTATYTYYRCSKKSKTTKCFQTFVREEELDKQLTNLVKKYSINEEEKQKLLKLWETDKQQSETIQKTIVQSKREEIDQTKQKLQFLLENFLNQTLERNDYLLQKEKYMLEKKTLEEEIFRLDQSANFWLEPLKNWIIRASEVDETANGQDLETKKVLAQEIFGSNLVLQNETAGGDAVKPWAALGAAPTTRDLVP